MCSHNSKTLPSRPDITPHAPRSLSPPGFASYQEFRQYVLLKTSLILLGCLGGFFSLINFKRGMMGLGYFEIAIAVLATVLYYLLRWKRLYGLVKNLFVLGACAFAIFAVVYPNTYHTIFVWSGLGPIFAFFLLGKKKGVIVCVTVLPVVTLLFIRYHVLGASDLPLVALVNMVIFIICVALLTFHYETTREETEKALAADIAEREKTAQEMAKLIVELEDALADVKTLRGLLPICSSCKKIRDDKGYWNQIDSFFQKHAKTQFSHGICPDCEARLYGNEEWYRKE